MGSYQWSQLVPREDKERATAWNAFNLANETGMPRGAFNYPRVRTKNVQNFRKLSNADAGSLYHNFYGLDIECQIAGATESYDGTTFRNQHNDAKIKGVISYQKDYEPYQRYYGFQPETVNSFPDWDPDRSLTSIEAYLYSCTNNMSMFFSQNPPTDNNSGFVGYGIDPLFELTFNAATSRYYGGTLKGGITIASYEVSRQEMAGTFGGQDSEGKDLYIYDGSYQKHLSKQTWSHPALKPDISYSYQAKDFTLRDNQGNNIGLKITQAHASITSKYPKWKTDEATGESYIAGAIPVPPPKLVSAEVSDKALFYDYRGLNTITPSPVLRTN